MVPMSEKDAAEAMREATKCTWPKCACNEAWDGGFPPCYHNGKFPNAIVEHHKRLASLPPCDASGEIERLQARNVTLETAITKQADEIQQTLGKALGYPWYKDNFPGATEENGVCIGEHVAESIAVEAAKRIAALEAENARLREEHAVLKDEIQIIGLAVRRASRALHPAPGG